MDALLAAAARALDMGDVLGALKRVGVRTDAPALALRGVALARLGKLERARELLRSAARAFGEEAALRRARCLLADAEIAMASRDLRGIDAALTAACTTLASHGDHVNGAHARCLLARSQLLQGRLHDASTTLDALVFRRAPPFLVAEIELTRADLHLREPRVRAARRALDRAEQSAKEAHLPALVREVARLREHLSAPAARTLVSGAAQTLDLAQVEALLGRAHVVIVDAREVAIRTAHAHVSLARRPVLFALARALAEGWPSGATRASLILRAFAVTRPNESHRARLRVEIARLRRVLQPFATVDATTEGFRLSLRDARELIVLTRLAEDEHAPLLALLADGEAWSSSALAVALGSSQRSVQRALLTLESAHKVRPTGQARAKRWLLAPNAEFATPLLLPSALQTN